MKSNTFLIASLLILIGMGAIATSCEKQKATVKKAQLVIDHTNPKTGDDDDDPILQGKARKKIGFAAVIGAKVETFEYGTNTRVGVTFTDSVGDFSQQVKKATYYFRVSELGVGESHITDPISVTQDTSFTILID